MKRLLLALLALLLLGSTAVVGQAASLDVRTASLHAFDSADRCADGPVTVTAGPVSGGSATGLEMDVPAGCHGIAGMLHLGGVAGATDVPFTLPASGTTATVPVPGGFPPDAVTGVAMTLGTWGVPTSWSYTPPATGPACAVYRLVGGVEVLRPATCTVTSVHFVNWWDSPGNRKANVGISFSYSGAQYPDYFRFTVDMSTARGIPAGWVWSTSGTRGGNLVLAPSYRCSSLPVIEGSSVPSWGPTGGFEFQIWENRLGDSQVTCTP